MPSVNDYDKNDDDDVGLSDGYTPAQSQAVGSATGGPKQAPTGGAEPQTYVPWSSFASANEDVSKREAGKLKGQVEGDVSKAQGELSSAQNTFDSGIEANSVNSREGRKFAKQPPPDAGAAPAPVTAELPYAPGETRATPVNTGEQTATKANASPANAPLPGGLQQGEQPHDLNPWAQLSGTPTGTEKDKGALVSQFGLSPDLPKAGGAPGASASQDLEAAAGQQPWQQLLSDTLKAQNEANALGSESGVQALLQQGQTGPTPGVDPLSGSAFDAALLNGVGQRDFQAEANKYGNNKLEHDVVDAEKASQDAWKQMQGETPTRETGSQFDWVPPPAAAPPPEWVPPTILAGAEPGGGGANPMTSDGGDPNGPWSADDDAAWNQALASGGQAAEKNGGKVEIARADNGVPVGIGGNGWGFFKGPGGGAGETEQIYVAWKDGKPDYNGWWGGATDLKVGDAKLTPAQWYTLAMLTPQQRARWWHANHPGE